MDPAFLVTVFMIAFVGSFLSGMLGVGGAIVNYPMLLYIPVLLGFTALGAHEVSGIVAVQVFFATLAGVITYRKGGYLNKSLIITMGASILVGSFIGAFGSHQLPEDAINLVYGILAVIAAILMFVPKKSIPEMENGYLKYNKALAAGLSFIIGIAAGVVGAGGAFLLVPVMLVILKIPTRMTIATSLAVTFISSIGAATGKVATGHVLFMPAIAVIVASLIASPLGATAGKKIDPKILQGLLAAFILATAVKIWFDIL